MPRHTVSIWPDADGKFAAVRRKIHNWRHALGDPPVKIMDHTQARNEYPWGDELASATLFGQENPDVPVTIIRYNDGWAIIGISGSELERTLDMLLIMEA